MKILIQQSLIIDPSSSHHGTTQDILIEDGIIAGIADHISKKAEKVIAEPDLHVSPGWVDIYSHFCDPGYEYKETLESGAQAAASGGYTDVFVLPNSNPVVDNKSSVEYIRQKSKSLIVHIHPIGSISKNGAGVHLADMYDMHTSGAIAFGDGLNPVQSSGLLLQALQYVKTFDGIIIQLPDDKSIGPNGLMNEGIISTQLGLPGKPMMAEELIIERDINLVRYAESRIHFTGVTSPQSLQYIKKGKQEGLNISCSVTPFHLYFSDDQLCGYDTNLKVYPPLRAHSDTKALIEAIMEGVVDCIATHHFPHEYDSKIIEFEFAEYGMIGLETTYGVLKSILPMMSEDKWVELLSTNPRRIFGLPQPLIETGQPCCMTLFNPETPWTLQKEDIKSKSKNTPFIGTSFIGKVIGIINGERAFFNS